MIRDALSVQQEALCRCFMWGLTFHSLPLQWPLTPPRESQGEISANRSQVIPKVTDSWPQDLLQLPQDVRLPSGPMAWCLADKMTPVLEPLRMQTHHVAPWSPPSCFVLSKCYMSGTKMETLPSRSQYRGHDKQITNVQCNICDKSQIELSTSLIT